MAAKRRPARRGSGTVRKTSGRRPAARRGRGKRDGGDWLLLLLGVGMVVSLVSAVVRWLAANWWVLGLLIGAMAAVGAVVVQRRAERARWEQVRLRGLRYALGQLDTLSPTAFEEAVAALMRRDGAQAQRLGGAGDDACDVKATDPFGRVWAIQCKHRRDGWAGAAVGTPVLQQVNGTAGPVHGAQVAVVVTNGRFSSKAVPWGRTHGIWLVDRHTLAEWASSGRPLWEVLGVRSVPGPRRPLDGVSERPGSLP